MSPTQINPSASRSLGVRRLGDTALRLGRSLVVAPCTLMAATVMAVDAAPPQGPWVRREYISFSAMLLPGLPLVFLKVSCQKSKKVTIKY